MCGIAGTFAPGPAVPDLAHVAERMAGCLAHRGPDDAGVWVDPEAGVALGHRRLAVIDTSAEGHQPMRSAGGRYVVVLNGEIYNFRDLAAELEAGGMRFRGHSDTEVLLAGVERWGLEDGLRRMVGMFAFALWDREERTLHLCRDRMGEKPLYYAAVDGAWVFGSELRALRAYPGFVGTVDRDVLPLLLRHGYIPAPHTIYAGVRKVRPGHVVTVRAGGEPAERPYWTVLDAVERGLADPLPSGDGAAARDALADALSRAVRQQMIADVPLGAFLSGGIDSSLVVALMQAESARPVRTFTIGFREAAFDEASHARSVAAHLGTDHTEHVLTGQDALDLVPRLPELYDEPFADSSQLPTHLIAAVTRRSVTVALSGDGGDELFGGYDRYAWGMRLRRLRAGLGPLRHPAAAVARLAAGLPGRAGDRGRRLAGMLAAPDDAHLYREIVSLWRDPERVVRDAREPATPLGSTPPALAGRPLLDRMMYWDMVTYLPDDILAKVDRAAMAVSLETRAPFLDHRLVELAWRIPPGLRRRNGTGKWVLRRLLDRFVPRALVQRPKMGFAVPVDRWLRGPLEDWASALLVPERIADQGFFRADRVADVWSVHRRGARDWGYLLWPVLMFQAWVEAR